MTPTELEPTIPARERPLGSAQSVMECKNCLEHLHTAYTQYGVTVRTADQRNGDCSSGQQPETFGRLPALGITLGDF
jgi:hypothetical protein